MTINATNSLISAPSPYQFASTTSLPDVTSATANATSGILTAKTNSPPHACIYCCAPIITPTIATTLAHNAGIITPVTELSPQPIPVQVQTETKASEIKTTVPIKAAITLPKTDKEFAALYFTTLNKYVVKMNAVTALRKLKPASDSINDKGVWYGIEHLKRMQTGGDTRLPDFIKKGYFSHGYTEAPGLTARAKADSLTKFENFTFDLVPGTKPSQVLHDLITGLSYLDCATALQVCILQTLEEFMGTERFNMHFGTLCQPSPSGICPFIDKNMQSLQTIFERASAKDLRNLKAGDFCHIGNVYFYHEKHPFGIGAGYNVIYDGANKYLGFGLSKLELPKIEMLRLDLYNEDPLPPAEVIDYKEAYIPFKEKLTLTEFALAPTTSMVKAFGKPPKDHRLKLGAYAPKLAVDVLRPDMQRIRKLVVHQ